MHIKTCAIKPLLKKDIYGNPRQTRKLLYYGNTNDENIPKATH